MRGAKGTQPRRLRGRAGRTLEEGLADLGTGRRAHRASAGTRQTSPSTRRAAPPASRSRCLKSFAAPAASIAGDAELLRRTHSDDRDEPARPAGRRAPIRSRAASTSCCRRFCSRRGRRGETSTCRDIIQQIQTPPVRAVGVMDLDSFFPPKDRFALAMALNNLLAAPGFRRVDAGRSRSTSVGCSTPPAASRACRSCSIAHLSDAERMFFVSLLLNQMLGWMRSQPGTTSLRALVYMDEIFGYFPPVANPPSKAAAADAAQTGARVRRRGRAGDAESGRPRLQGPGEHRHVVSRPPADRARQGARARRARGIGHHDGPAVRSAGAWSRRSRAREPDVRDEQRARGCARRVRIAMGAFVPARSARTKRNSGV